jgi:hypothetical protein
VADGISLLGSGQGGPVTLGVSRVIGYRAEALGQHDHPVARVARVARHALVAHESGSARLVERNAACGWFGGGVRGLDIYPDAR